MELVKYDVNDLHVPVSSGVIFEGVLPTENGPKSPFGETVGEIFTGDRSSGPVFTVNKIIYCTSAIMQICSAGKLSDKRHTMSDLLTAAESC